jgi:3-oxoacyl-[acyl-carrier protein] reductase
MKVIRGRKALVTGAADGIGRCIALALAGEGADLYLVDINAAKLTDTAEAARRSGVEVITAVCDLSQADQISATVKSLLAQWGGLDILVNNAAVTHYGYTHQMTAAQWRRVLAVNLLAPIQLIQELLLVLGAREEAHILNVSSMFGLAQGRKIAAYQTTKFGLVGLSLALRAEYGGPSFGVTALCPGFVATPMLDTLSGGDTPAMRHPIPAWLCTTPEKVAGCRQGDRRDPQEQGRSPGHAAGVAQLVVRAPRSRPDGLGLSRRLAAQAGQGSVFTDRLRRGRLGVHRFLPTWSAI